MAVGPRERLLGSDPVVSVAAPIAGVLVAGLIWRAAPSLLAAYSLVPTSRNDLILLSLLVVVPALLAVWNDGLVVCWAFDFGTLFAVFLLRFAPDAGQVYASGYGPLYLATAAALGSAVVLGTVAYLLGLLFRRWVSGVRTWWLARSLE